MTDKRTKQLQKASNKSDARRAMAYDIIKLMAQSKGVALPNARNGGVEFDEFLANKLAVVKAEKDGKMTRNYNGFLCIHDYGDSLDCLFLSTLSKPLADELSWISGKMVTVRYWITDQQTTKEKAIVEYRIKLTGIADAEFSVHYSDITGYLWTDENLIIGGHDLLAELEAHEGKWLILEIEAAKDEK